MLLSHLLLWSKARPNSAVPTTFLHISIWIANTKRLGVSFVRVATFVHVYGWMLSKNSKYVVVNVTVSCTWGVVHHPWWKKVAGCMGLIEVNEQAVGGQSLLIIVTSLWLLCANLCFKVRLFEWKNYKKNKVFLPLIFGRTGGAFINKIMVVGWIVLKVSYF